MNHLTVNNELVFMTGGGHNRKSSETVITIMNCTFQNMVMTLNC